MQSIKCALWAVIVETLSVVIRLNKAIRTPYIQESGVCYFVILYTVVGIFFTFASYCLFLFYNIPVPYVNNKNRKSKSRCVIELMIGEQNNGQALV